MCKGSVAYHRLSQWCTDEGKVSVTPKLWLPRNNRKTYYKWTTIIHLWWLSQWLVTHRYHLAVTIYLHVAPSTDRLTRQYIRSNVFFLSLKLHFQVAKDKEGLVSWGHWVGSSTSIWQHWSLRSRYNPYAGGTNSGILSHAYAAGTNSCFVNQLPTLEVQTVAF